MAENELKPCPFCEESKMVFARKILTRNRWHVLCDNCKCRTGQYLTRQEAVEAWNRRANDGRAVIVNE